MTDERRIRGHELLNIVSRRPFTAAERIEFIDICREAARL